jgi:hypothetical protein
MCIFFVYVPQIIFAYTGNVAINDSNRDVLISFFVNTTLVILALSIFLIVCIRMVDVIDAFGLAANNIGISFPSITEIEESPG